MSREFFKKHYPLIRIFELALDLAFIIFSFIVVIQIDEYLHHGDFFGSFKGIFRELFQTYVHVFTTQVLYIFIIFVFFMIYKVSATKKSYLSMMASLTLALVMSNVFMIILSFIFLEMLIRPEIIGYTFLSQIAVFAMYKYIFHRLVRRINKRSVMIIGPEEEALTLASKFLMEKGQHKTLKYILFEKDKKMCDEVINYIDTVDDVIILQGLSEQNKNNIMTYCLSKNHTDVYLVPKLYEINIVNSKVDQIRDTPVFVSQSMHLSLTQRFIKRTFDIVLSFVGLCLSLPILALCAISIKLHDKGPVFFTQERVTRNNRSFKLYKFRTMIVDAEKETGATWALENDPRITKIGKFLRATRIDELPQLYNVFKGEMSLIGPRPEREFFIQEFIKEIPDFKYRVNVKPGITGLAQVLGKYNSEPDDKLRFDLIYIRNYSIWLDIKIIFLTVKAVLDKDASAVLGIPPFMDLIEASHLSVKPTHLGLIITPKDQL